MATIDPIEVPVTVKWPVGAVADAIARSFGGASSCTVAGCPCMETTSELLEIEPDPTLKWMAVGVVANAIAVTAVALKLLTQ